MKKLIIFDLDGTLTESKSSIDAEMAALLDALLKIVKVSVISGAAWLQFEEQVLAHLSHDERPKNLSLLPTCGTKFYQYDSKWKLLYLEDFTVSRTNCPWSRRNQFGRRSSWQPRPAARHKSFHWLCSLRFPGRGDFADLQRPYK